MKTFIKILLIVGLSLLIIHCKKTNEDKMIKRIDETSLYYKNSIIKIDVIDTIYQSDIDEFLKIDTIRLEFLKEKFEIFDSLKNEIRKVPRPEHIDTIRMNYNKNVFDSLMMYDRWVNMINDKNRLYQRMNYYFNEKTDIAGYRVIVHYKNGRTNDFIIQSDYSVLCPSFMLEPVDSLIKFRPNMMRRPTMRRPRINIQRPNINEHSRFDKQPNGLQQGNIR